MFIVSKHNGADATRTAGYDGIGQRHDNSTSIEMPKGVLDIGPKAIVARHINHDIPKIAELLANTLWTESAPDLTTDDPTNRQVACFGRERQMAQRV
jgi:hypothetical protein